MKIYVKAAEGRDLILAKGIFIPRFFINDLIDNKGIMLPVKKIDEKKLGTQSAYMTSPCEGYLIYTECKYNTATKTTEGKLTPYQIMINNSEAANLPLNYLYTFNVDIDVENQNSTILTLTEPLANTEYENAQSKRLANRIAATLAKEFEANSYEVKNAASDYGEKETSGDFKVIAIIDGQSEELERFTDLDTAIDFAESAAQEDNSIEIQVIDVEEFEVVWSSEK